MFDLQVKSDKNGYIILGWNQTLEIDFAGKTSEFKYQNLQVICNNAEILSFVGVEWGWREVEEKTTPSLPGTILTGIEM